MSRLPLRMQILGYAFDILALLLSSALAAEPAATKLNCAALLQHAGGRSQSRKQALVPYLSLLRYAIEQGVLNAKDLFEIAATDHPVNPLHGNILATRMALADGFTKAVLLITQEDWVRGKEKVIDLARLLATDDGRRDEAKRQTRDVFSFRTLDFPILKGAIGGKMILTSQGELLMSASIGKKLGVFSMQTGKFVAFGEDSDSLVRLENLYETKSGRVLFSWVSNKDQTLRMFDITDNTKPLLELALTTIPEIQRQLETRYNWDTPFQTDVSEDESGLHITVDADSPGTSISVNGRLVTARATIDWPSGKMECHFYPVADRPNNDKTKSFVRDGEPWAAKLSDNGGQLILAPTGRAEGQRIKNLPLKQPANELKFLDLAEGAHKGRIFLAPETGSVDLNYALLQIHAYIEGEDKLAQIEIPHSMQSRHFHYYRSVVLPDGRIIAYFHGHEGHNPTLVQLFGPLP